MSSLYENIKRITGGDLYNLINYLLEINNSLSSENMVYKK